MEILGPILLCETVRAARHLRRGSPVLSPRCGSRLPIMVGPVPVMPIQKSQRLNNHLYGSGMVVEIQNQMLVSTKP